MSEIDGRRERAAGIARGSASLGYLPLLPTLGVVACLAAGSLYWREAPPRAPAGPIATVLPLPSGDPFQVVADGLDGRVRAPYPIEFEQLFPLIATAAAPELPAHAAPHAAPAAICDAVPVLPARDEMQSAGEGRRPARRRAASPRRAPDAPLLSGVPPPPRPESLRVAAVTIAPEAAETPRPFLALPAVVETGRDVVRHVAAFGEGMAQAGGAVLDLIDRRR
ncbi:hypothetical protein [Methylobacterium isbiliense]|uniref:hypothetical protein n=1 Tax=Methylobacterium isbiliense TaxID=315478 RepID=UPI0025B54609|nr:hypothetical protein [Methylobacterium isbiliense]MDN3625670.1 hypothetical protein [Methylobacterium isbiliense]